MTISSSNDSLTGIASAINAANIGVTASIMNDGSGTPYRLSLSGNNPGAASSMQISVSGDPALSAMLDQDPAGSQAMTETSTAQSAQFTLNGVAVTSATNTDSNVISGVTLNLLATNTTTPTTVTVSKNTLGAVSAINSFVSAYNTISSTLQQATSYNATTQQAGPLQGQNSVLSIMSQMQSMINAPVPGAPSTMSMLAQVGVGFQSNGTLSVNSTTLQAALASNPSAVTGLFASTGSISDSLINYTGSTSATIPGSYAVNVTQLATQGSTTGAAAAGTTITAGVNDTIQLNLNGTTANVVLAAGTYTPTSLASALQTAINGTSAFSNAGSTATVTQNNGILTIASSQYGSASVANITGGNGQTTLNGADPSVTAATTANGVDVAGTINGVSATGKGQSLTGATGDASSGLSIQITGGHLGSRGTVNYTQGYANELNNLMTTVLGKTGQIAAATTSLNATITNMQASIAAETAMNTQIQANYQAEFTALDVTMSKMTSTSTFLTQQLAALAASR